MGVLFAPTAWGALHFTLRGTLSDNNFLLKTQENSAASASISWDLGTVFRLGVTHRRSKNLLEGYTLDETTGLYSYASEKTESIANSIDLTIILYYGKVFVPFVQVGIVKKDYIITQALEDQAAIVEKIPTAPVPSGGLGLAIRLNKNFSLRLSHTLSPGAIQSHPDEQAKGALDSYTSVGISYNT